MITLIVKTERVGPIRGRHPWMFSGALKKIPDGLASGEPVELGDEQAALSKFWKPLLTALITRNWPLLPRESI